MSIGPMGQKSGLAVVVALLLGLAGACASEPEQGASGCTAATSIGQIAGRPAGDLCAYKGIPYAAPPVGDLRFKPPQPAAPWQDTLQATDGDRVCPQPAIDEEDYPNDQKAFLDEDCLHLNVWAPQGGSANRPVIVFVHGGAALYGTANGARYDGSTLAAAGGAVVVTLNYRLGALGWAELGNLDPTLRGSGNNGLRDQIAALTWVHDHIADFGGDPGNVTAVGQSEGAFSLSAILATDNPQRLFRRVVLESGSGYMVRSAQLEARNSATFLAATGAKDIAAVRAMSTEALLDATGKAVEASGSAVGSATFFGPYVDGTLVKAPTLQRLAEGNARGIDMVIGTNRDEVLFFAQFDPRIRQLTEQAYSAIFPAALDPRRAEVEAAYHADRPGESENDVVLAMVNDQLMRVPATRMAEAQAAWGRTFMYRFDWAPQNGLGAVHTAELPFVFGTLRFTGIPGGAEAMETDRDRLSALSERMVAAWTTFARTGDPSTPDLAWPSYAPPKRATMIWDLAQTVENAPRETERAAWDGYAFPALP
ncbi:carboxylesterase/lipase family protein [Pseudonocardia sp. TRM90224]|uniref:carboxylesterase/lipase family protein n=1 Tax=Pseudonocardia sp. TRM90224 TaxID=2812678 RepID=UPI001E64E5A2|nr:carboxylesterase family protein [Pseudonocardia sp. TRM90224]